MRITSVFKKIKNLTYSEVKGSESEEDLILKALTSNVHIDRDKAMTIPAVSSCVDLICNTFAMIPIKLYKEVNKEDRKVEEIIDDVRVKLLNDDTGDTLDAFQFKKAICEDYLMGKGGYAFIKSRRNKIISLHYVEDKYVTPYKNFKHIEKNVEFMVDGETYKQYEFITFLRNSKDGASGTGLVEEINKALETAFSRIMLECDLMRTCGNKKGFLKSDKHLDEKAMKKLKKAWNDYYDGNSSCVILNDGMEFKEASNTSVENQLNEKNKTFTEDMRNVFHIEGKYSDFIKNAIMPIITAFCTSINRTLLLESEKNNYYFAADMTELLKGDLKERFEAYKIAVEKGWMTRNEVRYKEDMNKLKGLDVISLSLADVLLNPETGEVYTPNTNKYKDEKEVSEANEE